MTVVLAATDFSPNATRAVRRAALLAHGIGARLTILHVLHGPSLRSLRALLGLSIDIEGRVRDEATARLSALALEISHETGITAQEHVAVGDAVNEIAALGDTADLLVVGAHGTSEIRDLLLGSTSERLLRRCRRPVLIVKRPPDTPYQRVLVPVAFGPTSMPALETTRLLVPKADTTVFNAFVVPYEATLHSVGITDDRIESYRMRMRQKSLRELESLVDSLGAYGTRLHRSVAHGEAAPLILAKEKELQSDLIVIGKKDESLLQGMLLGSVTRHVLAASVADILVVSKDVTKTNQKPGRPKE